MGLILSRFSIFKNSEPEDNDFLIFINNYRPCPIVVLSLSIITNNYRQIIVINSQCRAVVKIDRSVIQFLYVYDSHEEKRLYDSEKINNIIKYDDPIMKIKYCHLLAADSEIGVYL